MLSAWARRDVEKLAGFDEQDAMPDAARNHEGLSWSKLDLHLPSDTDRSCLLSNR